MVFVVNFILDLLNLLPILLKTNRFKKSKSKKKYVKEILPGGSEKANPENR
tara:strand:- start:35875 stop:36027 length:153 start_codon:yes stop_codon:yes gene_type:complete